MWEPKDNLISCLGAIRAKNTIKERNRNDKKIMQLFRVGTEPNKTKVLRIAKEVFNLWVKNIQAGKLKR